MRNSIEVPAYQHQTNIERPFGAVSFQPNFAKPLPLEQRTTIQDNQMRQAEDMRKGQAIAQSIEDTLPPLLNSLKSE